MWLIETMTTMQLGISATRENLQLELSNDRKGLLHRTILLHDMN